MVFLGNGMEITNQGVPLVDINRFVVTASKSRNESLSSLMRRLNICEESESGIDSAIDAIELFQLPAPKFIRASESYSFVQKKVPFATSKQLQFAQLPQKLFVAALC